MFVIKKCGCPCTTSYNPCGCASCISDITCRKKNATDTIGPPDPEDGGYHDNSGCLPQGGYNFSGTVPWSFWTVDVSINWTYSSGQWHFSGSVDRGTVPEFIAPFEPEIFGNAAKENDIDAGACSQAPTGAVVFFSSVHEPANGGGTGGYAPGPIVETPEAALEPLLDAFAEDPARPWTEDVDCGMDTSSPDLGTGDFSYLITQPRANLTGLTVDADYLLTFHYQKYVGGEWLAVYDLEVEFTAAAESETTDWIPTTALYAYLPGQLRLDPACPATLALFA